MDTSILESKLERLKISYSSKNGRIIIGKPKTDYLTIIGLITFPFFASIGLLVFAFLSNTFFFEGSQTKIFLSIVGLFSLGIFNTYRLRKKSQANHNLKTLFNNEIQITNKFEKFNFNYKNIIDFEYIIKDIDGEVFEGSLFLVDDKMIKHQILGFDDENEKYIENDLNWFSDFLENYVKLKRVVDNNFQKSTSSSSSSLDT